MLLILGGPVHRHADGPRPRQLGHNGLRVRPGLALGVEARIMQPPRQAPTGGFKVGKAASQCGLTATARHQQRGHKIAKGFALMPVCLRQHGVDIVVQASG